MTHDPVVIVELTEHDPAETIERLEAEGFVVTRQCVDGALTPGYRVTGTIGDERNVSILLPDAEALYWWWQVWWLRGYHERIRACSQDSHTATGTGTRRRRRARARG